MLLQAFSDEYYLLQLVWMTIHGCFYYLPSVTDFPDYNCFPGRTYNLITPGSLPSIPQFHYTYHIPHSWIDRPSRALWPVLPGWTPTYRPSLVSTPPTYAITWSPQTHPFSEGNLFTNCPDYWVMGRASPHSDSIPDWCSVGSGNWWWWTEPI